MQPPRPFRGASYDKDMFTFLPALANRDVSVESPRKRKLMASDYHITMTDPTIGHGSSINIKPKENAGDLRDREFHNFVPASSSRKSPTYRNYSDCAKDGHQNESDAPWHSNGRDFYDSRSECYGYNSYSGPCQSSSYKDQPSSFQSSAGPTYIPSNWSPLVTENLNQRGGHDSSQGSSHVGEREDSFIFQNSQSYGQQMPTLMKVEGSESNKLVLGESQVLHQNFVRPGAHVVGSNEKGCHAHNNLVETSSNIKGLGDSISLVGFDPTKLLGNNASNSIYSLQEANNIIQQALRLLGASSGTGVTVNQDGTSQGCADDSTMKLNSHTPNLLDSLNQRTSSKANEAGANLEKPITSGDKGSVNIDDRLKLDNGGPVLAEKLWDGTLQLSSTSPVVSAIALFKSGDKMQDFNWSGSVEVKGKVRLEAFEKYVQDLPRARSRGLMVTSLCCKEGSSANDVKAMMEVARKYKEGKKVGFAQMNNGVDMYICPHSDTVITILAKHGFFKGMSVVTEKSDPLLGCVVWRKNSIPAPSTRATVVNENFEKMQSEIGGEENITGNKSPEFCLSPCVDHSEQPVNPENKMTSISSNNREPSEFTRNFEINKPNMEIKKPTLEINNPSFPNQSTVLSDDEDLPEYDFGARVSQTVAVDVGPMSESELLPITAQIWSEKSTVSQNKHLSEGYNLSIQVQQEKETRESLTSSRPSGQGLANQNTRNQSELMIPNWPIEGKKPVDDCHGSMNPQILFDDDDMPEWCPPGFMNTRTECNEGGVGLSLTPRNSMVGGSRFTNLVTGRQLPSPPLPPLPPPPPSPSVLSQVKFDKKFSTERQLPQPPLPPLPPPPPRHPPPLIQELFFDKNNPSDAPATPSPQVQFQAKIYPSHNQQPPSLPLPPPPPLPPTARPKFSNKDQPAVNNFMHNRPSVPSTDLRFQNQHYPPGPPFPPPVPNKSTANHYMHTPAGVSSHVQFHYASAPLLARTPADKPAEDGFRREFSSGFTPNPVFRPQFNQLGMNNHAHHSGWRGSRP